MDGIKECKICVNTTINPSIKINSKGICNVCEHYNKYFNKVVYDLNNIKNYSRAIIDYISGMTDQYIVRVYNEIVSF